MSSTIAAISSGQMPAAIGVIRMSGPDSLEILKKCLHRKEIRARYMHSRTLYDVDGEKLDEVVVCFFAGPHSYTGEDSVEIYAHGGLINLSRILQALFRAGAEPAQAGEFSRRAFVNGKLDLARAEAVMDVIHAQNEMQCREAQRQLSGSVSKSVQELRGFVMELLCAVEATIDFSQEEDLAPLPVERLTRGTDRVLEQIDRMKRASQKFRASGYRTAIVGRPNAGKSSLFNHLVGHERAIVTEIAGTTTDTLEASVTLGHHLFELIDTAGITETENPVERIGVARARDQVVQADILMLLIDGENPDISFFTENSPFSEEQIRELAREGRLIAVHTKCDLNNRPDFDHETQTFFNKYELVPMEISTFSGQGIRLLGERLNTCADDLSREFENVTLMTSQRHIALLESSAQSLIRAREALEGGLPAECIAADLHDAANALDTITGAFASEDIINEIFSHFCVGK